MSLTGNCVSVHIAESTSIRHGREGMPSAPDRRRSVCPCGFTSVRVGKRRRDALNTGVGGRESVAASRRLVDYRELLPQGEKVPVHGHLDDAPKRRTEEGDALVADR